MDEDLRQELEWLNENLKAVVMNQDMIYLELKQIEEDLRKLSQKSSLKQEG
jgi:hypothetical protein